MQEQLIPILMVNAKEFLKTPGFDNFNIRRRKHSSDLSQIKSKLVKAYLCKMLQMLFMIF